MSTSRCALSIQISACAMGILIAGGISARAFAQQQDEAIDPASLSHVLGSYSTMLKTFNPNGDPSEIKDSVDGFLGNAKTYLAQQKSSGAPDETDGLIKGLVARTKAAQFVVNRMRQQGCLSSGSDKEMDWANQVVKGALGAQSCDSSAVHNSGALRNLGAILNLSDQSPRLFGGKDDTASFQKKLDFAQAVLKQSVANNTNAQNYIRYYLQGREPECAPSDEACRRYIVRLKEQLQPLDFNATLAQVKTMEEDANTALRKELRQLDATAVSRKDLTRAQADALDAFPDYHAKLKAIFDLPAVQALAPLPGSPFATDKFLRGTVINKVCLGSDPHYMCNYTLDGGYSHSIDPAAVGHLAGDVLAEIQSSKDKVLGPLGLQLDELSNPDGLAQKTAKFIDAGATPTSNPTALMSGGPNDLLQRAKVLNLRAESVIKDLLVQRPTEFGAALAEQPSYANHICEDLGEAESRIRSESHFATGVEVAVTVAGMAVPFVGEAGLAASPLLASYNFYRANRQVAQYQTALDDVAERGVESQALGQPKSLENSLQEYRQADGAVSNAKFVRILSGLGVFSSTTWSLNGTAKALSSSDLQSVRSAFNKMAQTAGLQDPKSALNYFDYLEKVGRGANGLGTATEVPSHVQEAVDFINLKMAVKEAAAHRALQPIPFAE